MDAHIFCTEHIVYLIISILLSAAAIVLIKLFCKSLKSQKIAVKISGAILLIFWLCNRIACYKYTEFYFFPVSLCGNLSLVFGVMLLFCKPDSAGFHFIVWPAIVFCTCANVYPTYITQDPNFWFTPTIFGLLHHSMSMYAGVLLLVIGWMKPSTKHMLAFPIGYGIFMLYGIFNITILGYEDSMNLFEPIITLGSIDLTWFLAGVLTTIGIWIVDLAADAVQNKQNCAVRVYWFKFLDKLQELKTKLKQLGRKENNESNTNSESTESAD